MPIDISLERLLTITAAARAVKPAGVNSATCWRWIQRGVRGVKLETVLIGGRRYTSEEALGRFFARTTAAADGLPAAVQDTPTAARRRHLDAVNAELAARGV